MQDLLSWKQIRDLQFEVLCRYNWVFSDPLFSLNDSGYQIGENWIFLPRVWQIECLLRYFPCHPMGETKVLFPWHWVSQGEGHQTHQIWQVNPHRKQILRNNCTFHKCTSMKGCFEQSLSPKLFPLKNRISDWQVIGVQVFTKTEFIFYFCNWLSANPIYLENSFLNWKLFKFLYWQVKILSGAPDWSQIITEFQKNIKAIWFIQSELFKNHFY